MNDTRVVLARSMLVELFRLTLGVGLHVDHP
jgi:hypothetical protein